MKLLQRSLATLVAVASTVRGAIQTYCPDTASNICFSVAVPSSSAASNSGNLYFQITAPVSNAWVALAIGTTMSDSNMFIVYQDGTGNMTVSPRRTTRHNPPTLDTSANAAKLTLLAGSGVTTDGMMIANVACANCESSVSLTAASTNWISAWKSGSSLATTSSTAGISQHDDYKLFGLDLTAATIATDANPFVASDGNNGGSSGGGGNNGGSGGSSNNGTTGSGGNSGGSSSGVISVGGGRPDKNIVIAHGIIMALVFVIMYPVAALLMPLLGKWQIHAAAQTLSWLLMWVGFGLGIQAAKERSMLFVNTHVLMGTIVSALLFIQPFLGYAHHMYYVKHQSRGAISYVHIFWGQSLIIIGLVNGGLGLELAGASTSLIVAYGVVAAVVFTAYAVVKIFTMFKANHAASRPVKEAPSPPVGGTGSRGSPRERRGSPGRGGAYGEQQQMYMQQTPQQNMRGGGYAPQQQSSSGRNQRYAGASPPMYAPPQQTQDRRRPYP